MGRRPKERKGDKARRCSRLVRPLGDGERDMLQLHPPAASRSPRAPGPRPACAVGLLAQPWRRTRPQGLCHVSTFYTTLGKKPQQANGAFEHLRKLCPRIRVTKRVAVLNPRPQLSVFPLTRSGLRSRPPPC